MNPEAKKILDMIRKRKEQRKTDMYDGGTYISPEYLADFYRDSKEYSDYFKDYENE